jgi:hypothetical protein
MRAVEILVCKKRKGGKRGGRREREEGEKRRKRKGGNRGERREREEGGNGGKEREERKEGGAGREKKVKRKRSGQGGKEGGKTHPRLFFHPDNPA